MGDQLRHKKKKDGDQDGMGWDKSYSYDHLLVITGYKRDYTFYKWGFLSTYN